MKWGIKVWVLADSHNGYFSQFEMYTGKKGNTAEKDLGTRVVKALTAELKGSPGPVLSVYSLLWKFTQANEAGHKSMGPCR